MDSVRVKGVSSLPRFPVSPADYNCHSQQTPMENHTTYIVMLLAETSCITTTKKYNNRFCTMVRFLSPLIQLLMNEQRIFYGGSTPFISGMIPFQKINPDKAQALLILPH
jgi:hypothetical protein